MSLTAGPLFRTGICSQADTYLFITSSLTSSSLPTKPKPAAETLLSLNRLPLDRAVKVVHRLIEIVFNLFEFRPRLLFKIHCFGFSFSQLDFDVRHLLDQISI